MRESSKSALGGVLAALSVSIMLLTYLSPFMVYAAPAFAGLFVIIIYHEAGLGWAVGEYVSVSLLSLILIADKEAAVFYICLFGFYPVVSEVLDNTIRLKSVRWCLKILLVNCSILVSFLLCFFVFGVDYKELFANGTVFVFLFLLLMNGVLLVYDFLARRLRDLYLKKLQGKVRRLFK